MAAVARKLSVVIRAIDGEVQKEIGACVTTAGASNLEAVGNFLQWNSTKNNFYVVRKPGEIVDVSADVTSAGDTTGFYFMVNSRDVNLHYLWTDVTNTINNRWPQPIRIAGGASVFVKME